MKNFKLIAAFLLFFISCNTGNKPATDDGSVIREIQVDIDQVAQKKTFTEYLKM